MMNQIRTTISRSHNHLWQDALGALALVVMLLVALHFPGWP